EQGRKMSKTLNNVIDPLNTIDQYGADALRYTLLTGSSPGNDMNLAMADVEYARNFGNKIWQMARYIQSNLNGETPNPTFENLDLPSRWILSRLSGMVDTVNR